MGLQLVCPLCGMGAVPERFGYHGLAAKNVQSLGGNRGFQHEPVSVPSHLRREIELYVARLYHALVQHDPFQPVTINPDRTNVTFEPSQTNVKFSPKRD
jgi:hypothetical protein